MENKKIVAYVRMTSKPRIIAMNHPIPSPESFFKHTKFANKELKIAKYYVDYYDTGRKVNPQPSLQDLIKECKEGNIDLILVPSCRYFVEDLSTAVSIVRELTQLEHPVQLYFEYENIHIRNEADIKNFAFACSYWDYGRQLKKLQAIRGARKRANQIERGTIIDLSAIDES